MTTINGLPSSLGFSSREGGLLDLPLRASNEGLLRPRVARAQEINRPPSFFPPSSLVILSLPIRPRPNPIPLYKPQALYLSQARPATIELIASLGKGPHIGQHIFALFLREAGLPRGHVWFAFMDCLE